MNQPEVLTPDEAAAFLKVTTKMLDGWRQRRTGPKYSRLGHRTVRYSLADIQQWLRETTNGSN